MITFIGNAFLWCFTMYPYVIGTFGLLWAFAIMIQGMKYSAKENRDMYLNNVQHMYRSRMYNTFD